MIVIDVATTLVPLQKSDELVNIHVFFTREISTV